MSFPFTTTNLPEPTKEEIKVLMAIFMQNSLMIQQLQLMVAMREREIEEEERKEKNCCQKKRKNKIEKEKQNMLKEEEVKLMKIWSEEKS